MDGSLDEGDTRFNQALSTDTHITLAETAPLEDTQEEIIIQTDDGENLYEAAAVDDLQGPILQINDTENILDTDNSIMGVKYENSVFLTDSGVELDPNNIESETVRHDTCITGKHALNSMLNSNNSVTEDTHDHSKQLKFFVVVEKESEEHPNTFVEIDSIRTHQIKLEYEANEENQVTVDGGSVAVPDVIHTETVVTTQPVGGDGDLSPQDESTPDLHTDANKVRMSLIPAREATWREHTKREMDRLHKRQRRKDPVYREQEREKGRERMKARRQDHKYREIERERDRIRRQQARKNNTQQRARERVRDRVNKRANRTRSEGHTTSNSNCDISFVDMDCSSEFNIVEHEVEIEEVHLLVK